MNNDASIKYKKFYYKPVHCCNITKVFGFSLTKNHFLDVTMLSVSYKRNFYRALFSVTIKTNVNVKGISSFNTLSSLLGTILFFSIVGLV